MASPLEQESIMKTTDQNVPGSSTDRIWKALRPSHQDSTDQAGADEPNEIRRLMLSSQEFRAFAPSAEAKPTDKAGKKLDGATMDIVFACLAICADEERRAMSFGSIEGANAMRRAMHAIKKKFGVS
jgi:hypothetical protein